MEARYSGFWLNSSVEPERGRRTARADALRGSRTPASSPAASRTGPRTAAGSWGTAVKLSHVVDSFLGGSHDIKIGLQYGSHGSDNLNGPNDVLTTFSQTGRPTAGTTQLPYHQGAQVYWNGVYVDDTFRLGARRRSTSASATTTVAASFPSFPLLDATGFPTGAMSAANDNVYSWNTFSPRVGLN